jgi:phosphoglycolate phosphatase-like HAD superfamily hydrolase
MNNAPRLQIDALIMPINDVLVDVTLSHREVVRQSVQLYLEQAIGLLPSRQPLLLANEVTLLQKVGNFTNYWDLTTAFILYFIELLPPVPSLTFPSKIHVPALLAYLQMSGGRLKISIDELRERKDIAQLAREVAAAGGGVDGADKALPRVNRHMLVSDGAVTKTHLVGRIFQELYLGADLFERIYQQQAVLIQSTGYIEHESLLIEPDILSQLSQKIRLGIVSGRSQIEATHSLQARQVSQFFQSVITLDDIRQADGKAIPDPWPLLETVRRLQPAPVACAYIGANAGNIQAARAANRHVPFTAIGCLTGAHDRETLRQIFQDSKADIILGHPNHLKELILG